jgi:ubiquinol-cytochrome c reductase cytochrome b subunit
VKLIPSLCVGFAALAMVSGIAIACRYVPAPDHAFAALEWLTTKVPAGQFIYSLHVWSTSLLIGALHVLLFGDLLARRYQPPRRCAWLTGLACYACAMGLGFTGSLLPWTQHAYWDAVVRIGLMEGTPVIGPQLATLVRGGDYIGLLTLVLYFAIHAHILGPLLAVGLWRRLSLDVQLPDAPAGRLPHFAALFAIGATCLLAVTIPAVLGAVADPGSTGYEARPEWWFLPLFQLRKVVSGPEEIPVLMLVMGLASIFLIAAPWLDPDANDRRRGLIMRIVAGLGIAGWLALLVTGAMDRPREIEVEVEKPEPGKVEALPIANHL